MNSRTKRHLYKTPRRKIRYKAQEHYLREDVNCRCSKCPFCASQGVAQQIQTEKQILIVDFLTTVQQLDLFEQEELIPEIELIILGSAIKQIQKDHSKLAKRLNRVLLEGEIQTSIFPNQHFKATYVEPTNGEATEEYQAKLFIKTVLWYTLHFQETNMNVIFLTNDTKLKETCNSKNLNVLTVEEYITNNFPKFIDVLAPSASEVTLKKKGGRMYEPYWKEQRLERGLESKLIFQGKLNVKFLGIRSLATVYCDVIEKTVSIQSWEGLNRSIHGDIVAVKLEGEVDDDNPKGKVVGIIEKNRRQYCGSLEETEQTRGWVLFIPVDAKIPKIRINPHFLSAIMNQRIVVSIDDWFEDSMYPQGHFVKSLGLIGDLEVETKVLLLEHDVPHEPWSHEVLACLPPNTELEAAEYAKRVDLRHKWICSIDPPGCKDIDDALHCEVLENGNFEVGVHIADVAHYVKPGTALDKEAQRRGTSVYLVDRRIDMLPGLLSTDLCSLKPNVDRFAFSIIWEMDKDANILETKFHRSIIHNKHKFAYQGAQDRIDSKKPEGPLTDAVNGLNKLAILLRAKRFHEGALSLNSPAPKFELGEDKIPTSLKNYPMVQANSLVEEFMLLANISVAKRCLSYFPRSSMLRRHPIPSSDMMKNLIRSANVKGFKMEVGSNKLLNRSLDNCVIENTEDFNKVIRMIATRCMTQAVYFSSGSLPFEQYSHFGLAAALYTHFTSPIRRYCDIIVHRQLAASLNIDKFVDVSIPDICDNINVRHRRAQYISRDSNRLFTLKFFQGKDLKTDAIITSVKPTFLNVYVPQYVMEERIRIVNRENLDEWSYDEENLILERSVAPILRFQVFDNIRVRIRVKESRRRCKLLVEVI